MKKIIFTLALFLSVVAAQACHFEFTTNGNLQNCKAGDVIIVNVTLNLTHRSCAVAPNQTKFKYDGMKIVGATDWKQESAMVYTRQIKVQVLNDSKSKISLTATRSCDKDGGYGVFELDKK